MAVMSHGLGLPRAPAGASAHVCVCVFVLHVQDAAHGTLAFP